MLTIVTLCFNNPSELEGTVESVAGQSVPPDDYLIVDSSDRSIQPAIQKIAESADARYEWVPPKGVYSAMKHSLKRVHDDSWVWWLNSSDWLAGKRSVEIAREAIVSARNAPDMHWLVGELLRVQKTDPSLHQTGSTGEEFVRLLRSGRIGFPHPSTIFRTVSLRSISPYSDPFLIASDYAMALRFAAKFGPPALIPATLAIHDPAGLTSRHPIRNTWEKSQARAKNENGSEAYKEIWRLPASIVRGILIRIVGENPVKREDQRIEHFPLRGNEPLDERL